MSTRALLLGLCLLGAPAFADTTPPDKGKAGDKAKAKGKTGAACKTNADCDQSQQPQTCRDAKCGVVPVPPT